MLQSSETGWQSYKLTSLILEKHINVDALPLKYFESVVGNVHCLLKWSIEDSNLSQSGLYNLNLRPPSSSRYPALSFKLVKLKAIYLLYSCTLIRVK